MFSQLVVAIIWKLYRNVHQFDFTHRKHSLVFSFRSFLFFFAFLFYFSIRLASCRYFTIHPVISISIALYSIVSYFVKYFCFSYVNHYSYLRYRLHALDRLYCGLEWKFVLTIVFSIRQTKSQPHTQCFALSFVRANTSANTIE